MYVVRTCSTQVHTVVVRLLAGWKAGHALQGACAVADRQLATAAP